MNDYLNRYFNDSLTIEEIEDFFSSLVQDRILKEEFIEYHNILGIVDLLPQKGDMEEARKSLAEFIKSVEKRSGD